MKSSSRQAIALVVAVTALVATDVAPGPRGVGRPTDAAAASPTVTASGSAATDIGRVSWTRVTGDATNLPIGQIVETPDGYLAIEQPSLASAHRFWSSEDGLSWTAAPSPVPAEGPISYATAAGEHWMSAPRDFRLWRSSDFASWTEVDLGPLEPPAVAGIDWLFRPTGLAAIGPTSVMAWDDVHGLLDLEALLGITLGPGDWAGIGPPWESELGEERPVAVRHPRWSDDPDRVGAIRVLLDGSVVSVIDVAQGNVVATIDADEVGVPAEDIAKGLNELGQFARPASGAVITGDTVQPLDGPSDITYLEAVEDRFVGLAGGPRDEPVVWASADGDAWEALGPPTFPSTPDWFDMVQRPGRTPSQPLEAAVHIDGPGRQRQELWDSVDGRTWTRRSVLATHPEPFHRVVAAFPRGYLGVGDDQRVRVSRNGKRWVRVKDLTGLVKGFGGSERLSTSSVVRDGVFFMIDTPDRGRVLWKVRVDTAD